LSDNNGHSCALHPFGCGNIAVQEKGKTAAVVWIGPNNIHGFADGALEKWAMSGEFGPMQKWLVGATAEGLLYRNRR